MWALMLNRRFKSLCPVSSILGQDEGVSIMDECDKKNFVSYVFEVLSSFASIDKIYWMCRSNRWRFVSRYFSIDCIHKWSIKGTSHQGIIDFQTLPNVSQRHYLCPFQWWGKTWSHVSYIWFFGLSNLKHYRITNWNKSFFL